ncbi:MAG TPA: response regulator [Euryarchaeota archaeon]|nr:response regulator [Euryarchaeota archaeon]
MKILIVDDNEAVQEIIRDILVERDHNVRLASTVDEAVEKIKSFEPDVVMLDSWVGEEDGMRVISRSKEEAPNLDLRVILIKTASEVAPTDNPYIKGWVNKPFKSSDILDAIEEMKISEAAAEVAETQRKTRIKQRQKKERGGLLHRKKPQVEEVPDLAESGIVFGRSYVMFEPDPEKIYDFVSRFNTGEYDLLIITSDRAKAIKERFSYVSLEVVPLTSSGRSGSMEIQGLGSLMVRVFNFIDEKERPVVVFDTFGDIVEANGINQSLVMLRQLMSGATKDCTFAVSVDAAPLTDKDRGILLHDMQIYDKE